MRLDRISANIRRRSPWEGVDLGFVMARRWFLPLWRLWWVTALPVTLLAVVLLHESPLAVGVVVWWCKPLYEPLLLFWLGRRLFGEEPTLRAALGQWRTVLLPRLFSNLTLRRLSPNRSFYLPVSHLEGLRGKPRLQRLRVLGRAQRAGSWLTIVGAHIEFILEYSLLALVLYLVPGELWSAQFFTLVSSSETPILWLLNGFWLLAMSVFAPFYVAGGFALYLTRRAELEAWELELAFRRMAPRFKPAPAGGAALLGALLLAGTLLPGADVAAREAAALTHAEAQRLVTEVLADEAFGKNRQERYWKYIGPEREAAADEDGDEERVTWWLGMLAEVIEYVLWVAAAVAAGWLLLHLLRLLDWLPQRRAAAAAAPPEVLFGMPVTPESLPADVAAAVAALRAQGQPRAALSLLYRAALVRLLHAHGVRVPAGATEGECRRLVGGTRPAAEAAYFTRLTAAWVRCAYGHAMPADAALAELTAGWQQFYAVPSDG